MSEVMDTSLESERDPGPTTLSLGVDESPPSRQCGRCRLTFPGDPSLHPTALREWWLCAECYHALFGRDGPPS
jgi:hypothetical protein